MRKQTTPKPTGEKSQGVLNKLGYIYHNLTSKVKTGLAIALTAGTLTACNPDLDKLEEKIVEQTIQVRDKMGTLKELNSQYKALQDIVDQKKETIVQTGKKMHNNIRNDEKELRAMRKKLQENSKKIKDNLQEIKTSRTKFTDAGGDINSLGEYPDFSATIQGYESELQSIELP